MWLVYALLCAFLVAAASIVQKKTLIKNHAMEFSATLAMITLIICLPMFFFIDYSSINVTALMIIYGVALLGSIAFLLVAKSIRHMELSEAAPMLVLGPGITAVFAFLFLGEKLTQLQVIGIAVLIFGSYLLELKHFHDIWHPIRIMKQSKYYYFIIGALFLYAICSIGDRYVLSHYNFDLLAYMAFAHMFLAINFLIMISIFHNGMRGIIAGAKNMGVWLLLAAMLTVGYRFAQMAAVKLTYVGLVLPIKRMSALFVTLIGGELFHEHHLKRKAAACAIMLAGLMLVVL